MKFFSYVMKFCLNFNSKILAAASSMLFSTGFWNTEIKSGTVDNTMARTSLFC